MHAFFMNSSRDGDQGVADDLTTRFFKRNEIKNRNLKILVALSAVVVMKVVFNSGIFFSRRRRSQLTAKLEKDKVQVRSVIKVVA